MKKDSEDKIQSECFVWFHNTYPQYRGLLCYNLNNSKNRIDGARNKAKGLIAGRSDMVLYFRGTAFMLEFKTPDGYQSREQREWQNLVESHGFNYFLVRSLDEFKKLFVSL